MAKEEKCHVFNRFATLAVHAGQSPDQWNSKAVVTPISLSTTFKQSAPGEHAGFEYSRSGNPTRNVAEQCLAALENGRYAILLPSGMAAITTIVQLLKADDHIVVHHDIYGGSNQFFREVAPLNGLQVSFVDATKVENVTNALKPNTKMVWLESPTNPTVQIIDICAVSEAVHEEEGSVLVVVDNTFASSYFQQPLELGADIVMHSCTKYLNGHADVMMGAAVTSNDTVGKRLQFLQNAMGTVPSPFDCYLLLRGLKTLHIRMKEHQKNSMAVARFLNGNSHVENVLYPGLRSHPQYDLAAKQMKGYSGMVSFFIKGGGEAAKKFLTSLKVFTLADSLGGPQSLATHPVSTTHADVPKEERERIGLTDNLIRLSVGLEDEEDLIADLNQALKKA